MGAWTKNLPKNVGTCPVHLIQLIARNLVFKIFMYFLKKTFTHLLCICTFIRTHFCQETRKFLDELVNVIPNSEYVKRGKTDMKDLVQQSKEREFTDIIVINEDMKKPSILYYC